MALYQLVDKESGEVVEQTTRKDVGETLVAWNNAFPVIWGAEANIILTPEEEGLAND